MVVATSTARSSSNTGRPFPASAAHTASEAHEECRRGLHYSHAIIRRALSSALAHTEAAAAGGGPAPALLVRYCRQFLATLEHHHAMEDEVVFPALREGPLDDVIATLGTEHRELDSAINGVHRLLAGMSLGLGLADAEADAEAESMSFDGARLHAALEELRAHLIPHLNVEEAAFASPAFLTGYLPGTTRSAVAAIQKRVKVLDPYTELAFGWSHLQPAERRAFYADMPWFARALLTPLVFVKRHRAVWALARLEVRADCDYAEPADNVAWIMPVVERIATYVSRRETARRAAEEAAAAAKTGDGETEASASAAAAPAATEAPAFAEVAAR
jgi:hypothetical protein